MNRSKSAQLFQKAQEVIPAGVNSPVRAFKAVGGNPLFIQRAKGAYLWDEDGNRYLDFCASWGPLIFGHAPDGLLKVLKKEMGKGTSFGAPTRKEVELALKIRGMVPGIEKVRLVSSGTEAVMSAIRLARGFTGRKKIVKVDGGYHGHVDSLLIQAGSGAATFGVPDSAGIPEEWARLTVSIPYNDTEKLEEIFESEGDQIAAFILEPVPANMGVILPRPGYLKKARAITKKHGALLIFDEVITGFRLAPGGAQEFFGVTPDLTTLGKIVGGGLPLAAFGGKKEIMDQLAPLGPVYQAGTLSGNPLAVTAALWMLGGLKKSFYAKLSKTAEKFLELLDREIRAKKYPVQLNRLGSMFTLFFTPEKVDDYASAKSSDTQRFALFFNFCAENGLTIAPSQFEANFISAAHTAADFKRAFEVIHKGLAAVCRS